MIKAGRSQPAFSMQMILRDCGCGRAPASPRTLSARRSPGRYPRDVAIFEPAAISGKTLRPACKMAQQLRIEIQRKDRALALEQRQTTEQRCLVIAQIRAVEGGDDHPCPLRRTRKPDEIPAVVRPEACRSAAPDQVDRQLLDRRQFSDVDHRSRPIMLRAQKRALRPILPPSSRTRWSPTGPCHAFLEGWARFLEWRGLNGDLRSLEGSRMAAISQITPGSDCLIRLRPAPDR